MSFNAQATTYEYDDLGRLIKVTQDSGSVIDYSYDPAGNRTSHSVAAIQPSEISVADASVSEGGVLNFVVTRGTETSQAVTVNYSTSVGSAGTSDFTTVTSSVTFATGETTKTIAVQTTEESIYEGAETLTLSLTSTTAGAIITDSSATGTITNDDTAPAFSINNVSTTESGTLTFTISKTGLTAFSHNITYVSANGTASSGDYTAVNNVYTFTAGQTSRTFTVATTQDTVYESNETVLVNLSAATSGATISDAQGVGTINNDDAGPSFTINNVSATEGSNLTFTITKTGATALSHNVNYTTANGSALAGNDYTSKSGTLSFTAGQTSATVTVTTTGDSTYENNETVNLNLSSATSGATISDAQGVGTINNNDAAPSFAVNNISVAEGGNLVFTINLSAASSFTHNINYTTVDGPLLTIPPSPPEQLPTSAYAGQDYTAKSGTLAFSPGQTSKTVSVVTTSDTVYEFNKLMYLNLSSSTAGATIADSSGDGTITNNDAAPSFTINNVSVAEGSNLSFTITKTGATALNHNVSYVTANGSAGSTDYTAASGTVTFGPSQTTQTVSVATTNDSTYENNETVNLNLSGATSGATIADSQGVGTINNNDAGPSFIINNISATEGSNLTFTITKTGSTALTHNINYATANGSAAAGSDYTSTSGTLSFSSGQTSQTVTVATTGDSTYENNETVNLNLSSATAGATIGDSQGVGTINNNDAGPSFTINNISATEGSNLTFTITKTGSTALTHNINYATANGSAAAGSDYTSTSGTLSFSSGQTSQTVTVATTGDSTYESNETLYLNLSSATAGATIVDSQGVGTINNNDSGPAFYINNVSVSEGGNLTYTITKSGSTASTHNVNYATANGSAVAGSDYTSKSGTLSFTPAQTSQTVTVATIEDSAFELAETVLLNLSAATAGATIGDSQGIGTISNDDGAPGFAVNNSAAAEGSNVTFTITLSAASAVSHSINYNTVNGPDLYIPPGPAQPLPNSAYAGQDYTAKSGTLTFSPGQTSKTVSVSTTSDSLYELNKSFYLDIASATGGATIADSRGDGTITNNDSAPSFVIDNKTVTEGGTLTFTVSTAYASTFSHNVNYATANGSAAAGSDYTAKSGTLTFSAGQTSKTVSVPTVQDSVIESNETLYVNLSSATAGATIGDSQGLGTINNDDTTTVITVRTSGGTLQSPYTQSYVYNPFLGDTYYVYDASSTAVFISFGGGYCDQNPILPVAGYSMTGNGCEMTYTP
ncbi:hypothetical protein N9F21_01900 [Porticoccaceae bacterium]|nr:hypothetical protein [Porticoccaceae bacterium]